MASRTLNQFLGKLRYVRKNDLLYNQQRSFYLYSPEPFHPIPGKEPKWMSAEEAVSSITSGHKIFIHGCAATPTDLVDALAKHGKDSKIKDVEVIHIHTEGPGKTFKKKLIFYFFDSDMIANNKLKEYYLKFHNLISNDVFFFLIMQQPIQNQNMREYSVQIHFS